MCCGKASYQIAAASKLFNLKKDTVDIYANDKILIPDLETLLIMIHGAKRAGGHFLSPSSVINDGYLDFSTFFENYGRVKLVKLLD